MRRLIIILGAVVVLLAAASPAAAAPPVRQSGTFETGNALASDCNQQGAWLNCTDLSVDFFVDSGFGFADACVSIFTYRVRANGSGFQPLEELNGCGPAAAASVADDLGSASLSATIQVGDCGPTGCAPTESVTVAGEWTAIGDATPFSSRSTFKDGTCTFTHTSTGERAEASAVLTLDGEAYESVFAFIAREETTFTERCR